MTTPSASEPRPSQLTPEDRARLRQEMLLREEIRAEIENGAGRKQQPFWRSPVLATVVGGLFLNLFGGLNAYYEKRQARDHALLAKRISIASSFAQDMNTTTSIRSSLVQRRIWLKTHPDETAHDAVGMTRAEVLKLYVQLWESLMRAKQSSAILTEVRYFFGSPEVLGLTKEAAEAYDAVGQATTDEEFRARNAASDKVNEALLVALGAEVKAQMR